MFGEVTGCSEIGIKCFVDNKSLVDAVHSSTLIEDRRLRIDMAVLRNMLDVQDINDIIWVNSSHQLANCLTKRGASAETLRRAVSSSC